MEEEEGLTVVWDGEGRKIWDEAERRRGVRPGGAPEPPTMTQEEDEEATGAAERAPAKIPCRLDRVWLGLREVEDDDGPVVEGGARKDEGGARLESEEGPLGREATIVPLGEGGS